MIVIMTMCSASWQGWELIKAIDQSVTSQPGCVSTFNLCITMPTGRKLG
jgi:hypothetical protein